MSNKKQEKLHRLLQDNDLNLSLADLIEFTYHQWSDGYLSVNLAAEHIEASAASPLPEPVYELLEATLHLGKMLYLARYPKINQI